ncbi:hypothetical protein K504DRAFT_508572 [Pleomassaria siparia CBS 279.74]|uniref:Histone-lysine N-methyltransferase, H3 lysine-4 specific n=1 Tax=Pleomassaria siparia CBS 279.74 TaxID=1314801 RepID=A0A6G1JRK8_9PLEO|nr:hypothetical protein K504DRAFT_508572 [Pleomassaria siparia CBS 279.74]
MLPAGIKGPGEPKTYDGSGLRIGIVHARWNTKIIDALLAGTQKALSDAGVKPENISLQSVPGSYELPYAVKQMFAASQVQSSSMAGAVGAATDLLGSVTDLASLNVSSASPALSKDKPAALNTAFDAIIAIGVLIKGETMHFEYIADAVSHGLMRIQIDGNVPVIFGLLTLLSEEQGLMRAGIGGEKEDGGHNHGLDWGSAAVELGEAVWAVGYEFLGWRWWLQNAGCALRWFVGEESRLQLHSFSFPALCLAQLGFNFTPATILTPPRQSTHPISISPYHALALVSPSFWAVHSIHLPASPAALPQTDAPGSFVMSWRASAATLPDSSSGTTSNPHLRRGRSDNSQRRTGSHRAGSSVTSHSPPAAPAPRRSPRHATITSSTYPADDDDNRSTGLLNGVGSASSVSSTTSSVFSSTNTKMAYPGQTPLHALTPLTSTDSSPPGKLPSPRSGKPSNDTMHATASSLHDAPASAAPVNATITPVHTPPESRRSVFITDNDDGTLGSRITYDPGLDPKQRRNKALPPKYVAIIAKDDPSPPPDPRLAIAGYTTGKYVIKTVTAAAPKCKLRMAPYVAKPYTFDQRISCGPGPPTQVVVTGFDPLTSESHIRAFFTTFGEVEAIKNQVHPDNGSPLGVCLVKFRDTPASRGVLAVKAASSAKRAEREGTNQRIGLKVVKIQSDREGKRCDWLVNKCVEHSRGVEEKRRAKLVATVPAPSGTSDLPANVPKGPSGKGIHMRPPHPSAALLSQPPARITRSSLLVEQVPIKPQMKRTPYIFIAHQHVPVLSTTIVHLKKRLKSFVWTAVRCDPTGYFVTFEESKRGEDETVKCFNQCHTAALFTYSMFMECNQYGDPDYERSPSPERVVVEKKRKAEALRVAEEEMEDLEWEKRQRAEALDPVLAAAEIVKQELLEKLASDIKSRIASSKLLELMAPARHESKRRKLNVADPQSKEEEVAPPAFFARGLNSPALGTPHSRASGFAGRQPRKALAAYDGNRVRGKKPNRIVNAFADERRKVVAPRRRINNPMAQLLALEKDLAHETDDDEGRSSFTRDTEEQESRPMSRAPSTESEDEESSRAHRAKRRRVEAGWGEESDDEMMDDSHARSLLAHLIHKDPENMAEKELEQVLAILPRSSPIWKKAEKALKGFKRLRKIQQEADAIFGVETITEGKLSPAVIVTHDEEEARKPVQTTEMVEPVKAPKKKPNVAKPKKKTKKQMEEEAKAEKAGQVEVEAIEITQRQEEIEEPEPVVEVTPPQETPEEEERASVHYGVSTDRPQRTVDDDLSVVMDIDGWQHLLKDDEDLGYLNDALLTTAAANIDDPLNWAWKQKQIKNLNRQGEEGVSRTETKIAGYYVPNSTGSARTEGVKKIRESEKSKYLPHRIRVQIQREERERRAKNEARTTTTVEGFKFITGSKPSVPHAANSRANRANNRRLVNDINISKNMAGVEGDAMRFNQLKKRKKLVKFDRSAIHNWGLYAQESITVNDMIIEYVGEKVRQRVADLREAKYDIQGVGSSYLFRIDEDTVVDATKMGGIARFINHSCTPNCTAKIIRVDGTKRIVIYALRDIGKDEELTYDYKFEREMDATDRIPCLCGSIGCKGFLN